MSNLVPWWPLDLDFMLLLLLCCPAFGYLFNSMIIPRFRLGACIPGFFYTLLP